VDSRLRGNDDAPDVPYIVDSRSPLSGNDRHFYKSKEATIKAVFSVNAKFYVERFNFVYGALLPSFPRKRESTDALTAAKADFGK
jgi:hypothetical protein